MISLFIVLVLMFGVGVSLLDTNETEAHAAFPGTWATYNTMEYGNLFCVNGIWHRWQQTHVNWQYYDTRYKVWYWHHDHTPWGWFDANLYIGCYQQA